MTDGSGQHETTQAEALSTRARDLHFWDRGKGPIQSKILNCRRELTAPTKLVLLKVLDRAGDGVFFQRQENLADELGMNRKTVAAALQTLVDRGFLTAEQIPHQRQANQYFLERAALYDWVDGMSAKRTDQDEVCPPDGQNMSTRRTEVSPLDGQTSTYRGTTNKNSQPELTARRRGDVVSSSEENLVMIIRAWEEATGTTITPQVADDMAEALQDFDFSWVLDAVKETGDQGKTSWKYTRGILRNWKQRGRNRDAQPRKHRDPMMRSAEEVKHLNSIASDKSFQVILDEWREAGVPEEMIQAYLAVKDHGTGEEVDAASDPIYAILDAQEDRT
jgi:DnaD/phage-associated family protein